ncbi:MAG: TRAP transporter permease [Rhodospirillales bacterium]|nr:TRAP transporter permease [Rhodospirillales bacterium]MBO6787254.1 TRAP transporter permease [Rhodospirillales bacterium]
MSEQSKDFTPDQDKLQEMIADSDTGGRSPEGIPAKVLWGVPLAWSLFQLWYASPLPYIFNIGLFNSTEARSIHLAFAVFLAFTAYPTFKSSPRNYIPIQDWIASLVGAFAAGYLFLFYNQLAERPGLPTTTDLVVSWVGLILVLEATRRALGPPLMIVAAVFLLYTFFGDMAPDMISWKGASTAKAMSHYYLTTEGMFGVALGVSTGLVFLFVLFGSLLEKAGAGNYFIRVAFALMGHMRGGPAKAAVVSSALTGLVSGSAIANVVTTGTFTIPLMKKVGFTAEKAGAVEVASSTNGQLTPPVMGAVAFLMVEYVGISYVEVIKHAFLPAMISYIALVYIVHLEALKANLKGLPRRHVPTFVGQIMGFGGTFVGLAALSAGLYYGLGWTKDVFGDATLYAVCVMIAIAYVGLVWYATKVPELETTFEINELPDPKPTIRAGLYYLLPVVVLIWCLVVERLSPSLSAFWASILMLVILVTQNWLKSIFRAEGGAMMDYMRQGVIDGLEGLVAGARNMIGIGVATAVAGIVVGTLTLTGVGALFAEVVEYLSGGYVLLMLILTAILSLILGMGLPTTANYIVVSSLMAPVIVTVGAEQGLIVPLVAVHMFVFYFGILADDTPPVAMAAFAASAISGGDPIRTGVQGFLYDIRTAILPFLFIFNTELLMIGIESWVHLVITIVTAIIAMLLFAAATQGFFIVRSRIWETVALLLIAFTLFRPGYWMDQIYPPLVSTPATQIYDVASELPENGQLRIRVKGETLEGAAVDKTVMLNMGETGSGEDRLMKAGLELREDEGKMIIDNVQFGSPAERQKLDFDWEVVSVEQEADRPDKQWFYIPALLLLFVVVTLQRRRLKAAGGDPAHA